MGRCKGGWKVGYRGRGVTGCTLLVRRLGVEYVG